MREQSEMTAPVLVCENETLALDGKIINNQYFWYQKIKYIIVMHKKVWYY